MGFELVKTKMWQSIGLSLSLPVTSGPGSFFLCVEFGLGSQPPPWSLYNHDHTIMDHTIQYPRSPEPGP